MDIICPSCNKVFLIPDVRIPRDRAISLLCPSCRGKIQIDPLKASSTGQDMVSLEAISTTPLDDEIESMGEGIKRALVCLNDRAHQEAFRSLLESMQYRTRISSSSQEAIERMRFIKYDVIVLHEEFDGSNPRTNPILQRIKSMQMDIRRDIFFVLVGKGLKTLNNMMALVNSANLVVNENDISRIDKFLPHSIMENERFYRVFKETKSEVERG